MGTLAAGGDIAVAGAYFKVVAQTKAPAQALEYAKQMNDWINECMIECTNNFHVAD